MRENIRRVPANARRAEIRINDLFFTESLPDRNRIVTCVVQCLAMDIDALHSALLSVTVVSEKLRKVREELPGSASIKSDSDVIKTLEDAEGDLRLTKATLAGELGFNLCPHCWPPELLATDTNDRPVCPRCGVLSYDRAA